MSVILPESLRQFAEGRIAAGEFENLEAYLASLVAADQEALEVALRAGLASGEARSLDMAAIRDRARVGFSSE